MVETVEKNATIAKIRLYILSSPTHASAQSSISIGQEIKNTRAHDLLILTISVAVSMLHGLFKMTK